LPAFALRDWAQTQTDSASLANNAFRRPSGTGRLAKRAPTPQDIQYLPTIESDVSSVNLIGKSKKYTFSMLQIRSPVRKMKSV
jgi:hypothetical protein